MALWGRMLALASPMYLGNSMPVKTQGTKKLAKREQYLSHLAVQSSPLIWSTDVRSIRLYGQFLSGPHSTRNTLLWDPRHNILTQHICFWCRLRNHNFFENLTPTFEVMAALTCLFWEPWNINFRFKGFLPIICRIQLYFFDQGSHSIFSKLSKIWQPWK